LLRYEVHQIRLEGLGLYYLPLPKLNATQVHLLREHLRDRGFSIRVMGRRLRASAGATRLTVDPIGLSWSSGELLDAITPALPVLLSSAKEEIAGERLDPRFMYFTAKKLTGRRSEIQLFPRMEASRSWDELRKTGLCGLTPDEKSVIASLLHGAEGKVECVTDFMSDSSVPMLIGRRLYFSSLIPVDEFASSLLTVCQSSRRNSFLPRSSILRVALKEELDPKSAFGGLGEWCYLDYSKNL